MFIWQHVLQFGRRLSKLSFIRCFSQASGIHQPEVSPWSHPVTLWQGHLGLSFTHLVILLILPLYPDPSVIHQVGKQSARPVPHLIICSHLAIRSFYSSRASRSIVLTNSLPSSKIFLFACVCTPAGLKFSDHCYNTALAFSAIRDLHICSRFTIYVSI